MIIGFRIESMATEIKSDCIRDEEFYGPWGVGHGIVSYWDQLTMYNYCYFLNEQ